jgi:hypothetical protein
MRGNFSIEPIRCMVTNEIKQNSNIYIAVSASIRKLEHIVSNPMARMSPFGTELPSLSANLISVYTSRADAP